jgi:hypothetical protein
VAGYAVRIYDGINFDPILRSVTRTVDRPHFTDAGPLSVKRGGSLDQIDELSTREIPMYRQGNWENPAAWKSGAAQLRQRVETARGAYRKLLREAQGNGR